MARLAYSRTYPHPRAATFDRVLGVPLEEVLGRRHLAIPAVRGTDETAPWGEAGVGQRRVIRFSDGGSVVEELTELRRPEAFGYRFHDITGPMRLLLAVVDGRWSCADAGAPGGTPATTVTWTWDVRPTLLGRPLMPAFGLMWRGAAAKAFDRLGERLG